MGTTQYELQQYDLNRRLPAAAATSESSVWNRYRHYPVFSRPWLHGRSLLFCPIIAVYAALSGISWWLVSRNASVAVAIGAVDFVILVFVACAGPALATYVRYRGLPAARTRVWITGAILTGIALSVAVWSAANTALTDMVSHYLPQHDLAQDWGTTIKTAFRLVFYTLVCALLGGGIALSAYFSEPHRWLAHQHRQEFETARAQAREADLRLGVLQAQVEPHFLFNTLASIRLLIEREPQRAAATLDALVVFLRATIPQFREPAATQATLGQQLEICRSYLDLMQIRMAERLQYTIDADPQLLGNAFPPAILITLVENAVKHGIEPKPGPGSIEVRAHDEVDRLLIRVLDNGAGLKPGLGRGVGLANVRGQLASRFGTQASLRLYTLADQRTCAEVSVPRQFAT